MKKIVITSAIIALILVILIWVGYLNINQKPDNSKLYDYYQTLAKECESKQSYGCCISSVNNMADGNYKLMPDNGCLEGYKPSMLKCIDSFKWCEPSSTCAKEGEIIGAEGMPEVCCFDLEPVSGWPGDFQGDCSIPPPTGLAICSNCGDYFCNLSTGENKCNCAKDCNGN